MWISEKLLHTRYNYVILKKEIIYNMAEFWVDR